MSETTPTHFGPALRLRAIYRVSNPYKGDGEVNEHFAKTFPVRMTTNPRITPEAQRARFDAMAEQHARSHFGPDEGRRVRVVKVYIVEAKDRK